MESLDPGGEMDLLKRIQRREAVVAIVGMGYVGLPLAIRFAGVGFSVLGVDVNADCVAALNAGRSHIQDVASDELRKASASGKFRASIDFSLIGKADVVIICVPTPLTDHRHPDLSYIEAALESILPHLHANQLVVLESTTYPGTTQEVLQPRIESRGFALGKDIFLAFSPERVDPGNVSFQTSNTPKVVGGVTPACTEVAVALYSEVIDAGVHAVSSPRAAEMTKLLENIFRVVNISLVNELALLSERMGIDIWEVVEAAKTKPFGFMPFYPGPGLGGHCIPLDPLYLSWKAKEYGFTTRFIDLAGEINEAMPRHVVERATEVLNTHGKAMKGARVLLLGVAYKANIGDTRESPALRILQMLQAHGAIVNYHDPYVPTLEEEGFSLQSTPLRDDVVGDQDLVLITTGHECIDFSRVAERAVQVLDTRGVLRKASGRGAVVDRLGAPRISSERATTAD